jgi:hypothetical protein
MKRTLAIFVALLVIASPALAQTSSQGTILGTVSDSTGGVLPGAQIRVVGVDTGLTREAVTDSQGDFRVDHLAPGHYLLVVKADGFRELTLKDIHVLVGQALRVKPVLAVLAAAEVSVTIAATPLNTVDASRGEVIQSELVANMPLNGREFLALATLTPGAVDGSRPGDNPRAAKGSQVVAYNGARGNQNSFFLDGAKNTAPEFNNMISSPSVDAVQEFRVETNMYSARYGQAGGAIISVVTKSGTNNFRGNLYEYHRNDALDAAPYFREATRDDEPDSLWNQFGGSAGGPVLRNRSFFFFNSEAFRRTRSEYKISFAPTAEERAGDVSHSVNPWAPGAPVILTDPYSGAPIPSGILPEHYITPIGRQLMSMWPEPNYPADPYFNYRVYRPAQDKIFKVTSRFDYRFSDASMLSATFNFGNYDTAIPGIVDTADKQYSQDDRLLALNFTQVLRPNLVHTLGASGYWFFSGDHFRLDDKNYGVEWGLDPSVNVNNGAPNILFFTQGFSTFSFGNNGDNKNSNRGFEVHDDASWVKGAHTVQFGGSAQRQRYDWQQDSGSMLYYMNLNDGVPGLPHALFGVTGSPFTNLLATLYPLAVVYGGEGQYTDFQRDSYALYLQDNWRVHNRLTLNLGLRWEYERPFEVLDGRYMFLDEETGKVRYTKDAPGLDALKYPHLTGGPSLVYEGHPKTFMPRLGFAWQARQDGRTVVRAGYGTYFLSEPAWVMQHGAYANPFGSATTVWQKGLVGGYPDGDHLTTMDKPPYGIDLAQNMNPGFGFIALDYDAPRGRVHQWNLTLGQQWGAAYSAEVAYVGTRSYNLTGYQGLDSWNKDLQAKVLANYPGWNTAVRTRDYGANYHGLQIGAKKTSASGLTLMAAYTWSKAMAEASNEDQLENVVDQLVDGNVTYRRFWSLAGQDIRHRFSLTAMYPLPFGRGRAMGNTWNGVLDGILGGWDVNAIYQAQSGFPFSVKTPGNLYPDRICDGNLPRSQRTPQRWFDYECFPTHIDPVTGAPASGDASSNIIIGPGRNNLDLGIHKQFSLGGSRRLELRTELFNALNHPQFKGSYNNQNWFFNTPTGAELTSAHDQRTIQLALRFEF